MSHQISFALTPANSGARTADPFRAIRSESAPDALRPVQFAMPRTLQPADLTGLIIGLLGQLKASLGDQVSFELDLEPELPPVLIDAGMVGDLLVHTAQALVAPNPGQATVLTLGIGVRDFDATELAHCQTASALPAGRYVVVHLASRLEDRRPAAGRAAGLDLSQLLRHLELHGGGLLPASGSDAELAVRMIFPAGAPTVSPRPVPARASSPECRRVLLADDDEAVRMIAARVLQMLKFEVTVATDGEEALRLFEGSTEPFRAVMLDISMPNLDGISAAMEIRKISPAQAIVFISGDSSEDVARRLPEGLAAGVIQKPFSAAGIKTTLEQCVADR